MRTTERAGNIGLRALIAAVALAFGTTLPWAAAGAADAAAATAPQRFLNPASPQGAGGSARFGPAALEVRVYNLRGRLVFHGTRQGGASIVWDCRDADGRVAPSGVYIAMIRTADSQTLYQSFALVK